MTLVIDRIMAQLGCGREEAARIEAAARLLNRRAELRPVECLRPDEFASLVARAERAHHALSAAIEDHLRDKGVI